MRSLFAAAFASPFGARKKAQKAQIVLLKLCAFCAS
jgi:hypothetical protein